MGQKDDSPNKRHEFKQILDAADRFYQWWKDGEAKLTARQESASPAERKAA